MAKVRLWSFPHYWEFWNTFREFRGVAEDKLGSWQSPFLPPHSTWFWHALFALMSPSFLCQVWLFGASRLQGGQAESPPPEPPRVGGWPTPPPGLWNKACGGWFNGLLLKKYRIHTHVPVICSQTAPAVCSSEADGPEAAFALLELKAKLTKQEEDMAAWKKTHLCASPPCFPYFTCHLISHPFPFDFPHQMLPPHMQGNFPGLLSNFLRLMNDNFIWAILRYIILVL